MKLLGPSLSAALCALMLPCAGMAQKSSAPPAKLPHVELLGYWLGMNRAQADSVTAAHGWSYSMSDDEMAEVSAPDPEEEGQLPSLGPIFCSAGADGAACPQFKELSLTFKNGKISEITVSSLSWPIAQCASSWTWQTAARDAMTAAYGKPTDEPDPGLKPEMLATLDDSKTTARWLLSKKKYGVTPVIALSVLHTDDACWSHLMLWDMSELDEN